MNFYFNIYRLMVPGSPALNNSGNFSSIFGNRLKKGNFKVKHIQTVINIFIIAEHIVL